MTAKKDQPNAADAKAIRTKRSVDAASERAEQNKPAEEARQAGADARREQVNKVREESEAKLKTLDDNDEKARTKQKVTLHDGKPGSGSGLRPGDLHGPKSNPGAAAAVPTRPLQPESMQSHGFGIIHDKDLANPPYDTGDPEVTDEGPAGSGSPSNIGTARTVDKEAERTKAARQTARMRANDPDNPTVGGDGRQGDATASHKPIGTRNVGNDLPGGSNSGSKA